jgi:DHA2 family multidrug resistance protein-like MFS transporter
MIATSRGRWWALGAVVLAVLAVGLDLTVLSLALPTLAVALKASEPELQWFSSGYALVLAAAMLPAGLLGDRYGRKKVMLTSLSVFAAGSLACAYSRTAVELIAARVLLGLAGAGLIVMAVSALAVLFPEEERPKAVGIWAAANLVSFPIGPILGGWLLSHYWWGWVFLINVPIALIGFVAVALLVPESSSAERPGIDAAGVLLSSAGLVALTYGFIQAGEHGWTSPGALGLMMIGMALIMAFSSWERAIGRRPGGQPLIDLSLFGSPAFTWGVVLFTVLTLALVGLLFAVPQYFQAVVGTNAQGSGIRLLPIVGGMMLGLAPAPRVAKWAGTKLTVAAGFGVVALGLGLGATTSVSSGAAFVATWMVVVGAGTGLTMAAAASAAISELSEERAGVGSAVLQALKNTGAPLGSAVLGSVLSSAYIARLGLAHLPSAAKAARQSVFAGISMARHLRSTTLLASVKAAFVHGMDAALMVSVGFALLGLAISLTFLPSQTRLVVGGYAGSRKAGRQARTLPVDGPARTGGAGAES